MKSIQLAGYKANHFGYSVSGKVATITLNRPERKNPLTFDSYGELRDLFREMVYASDVKAVVFTGSGGNYFSGGVATIAPASALPAISSPAVLDAQKQPGWGSAPIVELNGSGAGAGVNGLAISGGGSTVNGFVINRFGGAGIALTGSGGNTITASYLGTNSAGAAASANGGSGVSISGSPGNTIGGTTAAARNVISGNSGSGVLIDGAAAVGNAVRGNHIGVNASNSGAIANGASGVLIQNAAASNSIGGTAAGSANVIAGNGANGVSITGASAGNAILGNSITGNTNLGIDLGGDGVTANNGGKNGSLPNSGMDSPVFMTAVLAGSTLNVNGYVGSAQSQPAFAGARVEIFKSDSDASGFGEGPAYLGYLTADANGNFTGSIAAGSLTSSNSITATATDGSGNTSEFGANFGLTPGVSGIVYLDANHNGQIDSSEAGTGLTLYAKIFATSSPTGPALQAVAVNTGTGAYAFSAVSAGSYTILIDNNNTLADVTPTLPAGYVGTEQPNQARSNVAVSAAPLPGQNFGLFAGSRIAGAVFADLGGGSGGVANDGALNGAEAGIAGAVVKLTNTTGATVHDTARTDATGAYALYISGVTGALKITETNAPGYVSTGASVGTTGGTYDRSTDTISFTLAANASHTGVNFGNVPDNNFNTDGQLAGLPGAVLIFPHTFIAGGPGSVTFSAGSVAEPANTSWTRTIHRDTNGNGKIDAGEPKITAAITVTAGQKLDILVKESIPVNAAIGSTSTVTLTATFSYTGASPALSTPYVHTDVATVGTSTNSALTLVKAVDKATAKPGETIIYTITYSNNSSGPLNNVIIHDQTPAFTTFTSASYGALPDTLTGVTQTAPGIGATGAIQWTFAGTLAPAATGTVTFSVTLAQ